MKVRMKVRMEMRTLGLLSIVMLLGVGCNGDSGSPTTPTPAPPPPEAMVTMERLRAVVGVVSITPPRLFVTFRLRIRETAGVGITLDNAQIEFFDAAGRFVNNRMDVGLDIAANGSERPDLTWTFGVNINRPPVTLVTTYRFVDDNGFKKELQLTNAETDVSGLREALSQLQPLQ